MPLLPGCSLECSSGALSNPPPTLLGRGLQGRGNQRSQRPYSFCTKVSVEASLVPLSYPPAPSGLCKLHQPVWGQISAT